jgi:hypothetical protein
MNETLAVAEGWSSSWVGSLLFDMGIGNLENAYVMRGTGEGLNPGLAAASINKDK